MSYRVTEQRTRDGLPIVRSWHHDCWHCNPTRHDKPADVIAREAAERAARPPMPEEVKEALRERTRKKAAEQKAANQRRRAVRLQERGIEPTADRVAVSKDDAVLETRYGPKRAVIKIIDRTEGGCTQVLLVCGHNKTTHGEHVKETRCKRCRRAA